MSFNTLLCVKVFYTSVSANILNTVNLECSLRKIFFLSIQEEDDDYEPEERKKKKGKKRKARSEDKKGKKKKKKKKSDSGDVSFISIKTYFCNSH